MRGVQRNTPFGRGNACCPKKHHFREGESEGTSPVQDLRMSSVGTRRVARLPWVKMCFQLAMFDA